MTAASATRDLELHVAMYADNIDLSAQPAKAKPFEIEFSATLIPHLGICLLFVKSFHHHSSSVAYHPRQRLQAKSLWLFG